MVKQFQINLNRQEGHAQRQERKRRIRERIILSVVTGLLVVVGGLTLKNDADLRGMVRNKQYQLNDIVTQIDSLQRAGQNVSKEDVLALARLDRERVLWTRKLVEMSRKLPEEMAITELNFERGTFQLHVITPVEETDDNNDVQKVKLLIDRLKSTPLFMDDFTDIRFRQGKRSRRGEQELFNFAVHCELGAPGVRRTRRAVAGGASSQMGG